MGTTSRVTSHLPRASQEPDKSGIGLLQTKQREVREDLVTDYQALADRHSEEVVQFLEEYGTTKFEIACQLQENEADRLATG